MASHLKLEEKREKKVFSKAKRIGRYLFDERVRDLMLRPWSEHYVYRINLYVLGGDYFEQGDVAVVTMKRQGILLSKEWEGNEGAGIEVHYGKNGQINNVYAVL